MSKKWVFSIFFVLLAVLGSAHFFLNSPFFSKKIENFSKLALEEKLGKKVTLEGLRLNLLNSSVVLEGLSIYSETAPRAPLFFAKNLQVFFSLNSLFTEVFVIRRVVLDAPELVLTDALVAEISSFKKPPAMDDPNGSSPSSPAFMIRNIQVTEGRIDYTGEVGLKKATLSGLALEVNPDLGMRNFELGFIAKAGTFSTETFSKKIEKFEAEVEIQEGKITVKKGKIRSGEIDLSVHGDIDFSRRSPLALVVNLRSPLAPEVIPTLSPVFGKFMTKQALSGEFVFLGQITGAISDLALEGSLALPKLFAKDETIGSLNAKLVYREKQLKLSDISGTFFSGAFSGEVLSVLDPSEVRLETKKSSRGLQASLKYNDLPADRLLVLFPLPDNGTIPRLKGLFLSGEMDVSLPKMRVKNMQAKGLMIAERRPLFSPPRLEDAKPLQKAVSLFNAGKMRWLWSAGGLVLNEATFDFPDLQLSVYGQWHPSKGYAFETALLSRDAKKVAHAFRIPFAGRLHVNGRLSGQGGAPEFEGVLLAESGSLKGQIFTSLISELVFKESTLLIKKAVLNVPAKNKIAQFPSTAGLYTATGTLNFDTLKRPRFDIKVEVRDGNPQEVFDFFHLKVPVYASANGALLIQGDPKSFFVKGPLQISAGSIYGEAFEEGWLDLTVTEKEVLFENVVLNHKKSLLTGKGGIAYDQTYWLALKGDRLHLHDMAFLHWMPESLRAEVGLVVSGKGSFSEPQLHFVGALKNLSYGDLQGVRGTIKADWVKQGVDFEANFPANNIALSGVVQLKPSFPFSFESEFEAFQLDPLFKGRLSSALADLQVRASGKLRGNGTLSEWERVNLSGQLDLISADFGGYQLQNQGPLPVLVREGTFVFQNAHFKGENTALTLNGNLTVLKKWGLFLKGEADLNLVTFFSKRMTSGRGTAHLDLAISDTWFSPQLRGELKMKDGKLRTLNLSQPITVADLSILFNEKQLILENLQGHMGGGDFNATGKAELSGFKVEDFGFLLELEKVRVDLAKNLPATLTGELFFQKKASQQTLKGDLNLRNIAYEKKMNLREFVLDFVKKKRNDLSEETPILGQTLINVHLYGDKEIWIENNLAKIPLGVDLLVKGSFDRPNLLGRIDILRGDIYFRHNTFKIVSGSVNFLDLEEINPSFELTARTDVRNISTDRSYTIDLNLSGTLSQVTLAWNAFPSLSDTDILSLLAIRKTTADLALEGGRGAGTEATNFVVTEFLSEPVNQISGIVGEPVEQITGIDNIRVEPSIGGANDNATVGTRLTAEKRLMQDRLVVIYTTTLDPSEEEVIRMVYEINKSISLVGKREVDGQLGGDIRFRFEIR